jgi:cytochrome c oxidase subunit IV
MSDHDHHSTPQPLPAHGPVTRPGASTLGESVAHDRHTSAGHGTAGHGTEGGADQDGHGHESHGHESHGGIGTYMMVFLALCGLTTMSFFTYSSAWPWRDQPQVGWAFMMAVSCTKAMLVVLFFMHVLWEANWKYVLTIPAAMMAIFLALMLVPDIGLRTRMVAQERALYMPRQSDVRLMERANEAGLPGSAAPAH